MQNTPTRKRRPRPVERADDFEEAAEFEEAEDYTPPHHNNSAEQVVGLLLAMLVGVAVWYYYSQGGNTNGLLIIGAASLDALLLVYGLAVAVRGAVERRASGVLVGGFIVAACVTITYLMFAGNVLQLLKLLREG